MGFFGKMFDKKVCDICGGDIGLLGNRKLDDGNLCKECAKKLSPWFEERRHSTVEQIKQQLAYREANKEKVQAFQVTREFAADNYHVFIDDTKGQFTVTAGNGLDVENNPDIVDLSQITGCRLQIDQSRREEQYRDNEGKMQDYNPPRYKYSYDYHIKMGINSPWFDDMDFKLNSFSVEEHDRMKIMNMENLGNQIVAALTGVAYSQPASGMTGGGMYGQQSGMPNGGMYGQQSGMSNGGMYGQQSGMPNGGMYGQQSGMPNGGMYGQQSGMPNGGMYGQQSGMVNNGMYGQQSGMPNGGMYNQQSGMVNNGMYNQQSGMQNNGMYDQQSGMQNNGMYNQQSGLQNSGMYTQQTGSRQVIQCDKCGWVPEDSNHVPKFCPQCGDPIDQNDIV